MGGIFVGGIFGSRLFHGKQNLVSLLPSEHENYVELAEGNVLRLHKTVNNGTAVNVDRFFLRL